MLLFVAFFFGLYVLSPGPVVRIYKNRTAPPAALIAFYAPLEYANKHCDPVRKFYDWYFKLWGAWEFARPRIVSVGHKTACVGRRSPV